MTYYELELTGDEYAGFRKAPIAIYDIQWDWEDHRLEARIPEPLLQRVVIRDTVIHLDGTTHDNDIDITNLIKRDYVMDELSDYVFDNRSEYI